MTRPNAVMEAHLAEHKARAEASRKAYQQQELAERVARLETGDGVFVADSTGTRSTVCAHVHRNEDDIVDRVTLVEIGVYGTGVIGPELDGDLDPDVMRGRWWRRSFTATTDEIVDIIPHRSSQMLGNVARRIMRVLGEGAEKSMGWSKADINLLMLGVTLVKRMGQP
jgi:hypothetical protein